MTLTIDVQPAAWQPTRASGRPQCVVVDGCEVVMEPPPRALPPRRGDHFVAASHVVRPAPVALRPGPAWWVVAATLATLGVSWVVIETSTPSVDDRLVRLADTARIAALVPTHADAPPMTVTSPAASRPKAIAARPGALSLRLDLSSAVTTRSSM